MSQGRGPGGDLHLQANTIELRDGGTIVASSGGAGQAGNILLQAGETFHSPHSQLTTETLRSGGDRIELRAGRLIHLVNSETSTSVRGGGGAAGNISIDSAFTFMAHSRFIANAFEGMGGNVRIFSPEGALFDTESLVGASSTLGIAQVVPLDALSGTATPMPQAFVSVTALLPVRCAARAQGGRYSSLVMGGRDGLPAEPSAVLPSPLVLEERLAADPAVIGALQPPRSPARFAFLAEQEKAWPRLRGDQRAGGCAP